MQQPRPWHEIGRHDVLPEASHDDIARFNAIANLNAFLAQELVPVVGRRYEQRARVHFRMQHGRDPADRHEVNEAFSQDPIYRSWSVLRRNTMEMRQQLGRALVLSQLEALASRAAQLNAGASTLQLDADLKIPRYVSAVDAHLMPGGYTTELIEGDVSAAANYDAGFFATVGGSAGPWNDAAGRALVEWLRSMHPGFRPQRIVDLGCGLGHNLLPVRAAFPEAEVIGIDVSAPMLRYGHARAASLGVHDVHFRQQDATRSRLPDASCDLVFSTMLLHETSADALPRVLAESRRLLRAHGLTIHLEQPPYRGMPAFEQFMRDWDGKHNNEPFWTALHEMSLPDALVAAGFSREHVFETHCRAPSTGSANATAHEDFGRAPSWYAAGAHLYE